MLRKKYLIVGSGLSSYFFLLGIKKSLRKNFTVLTGNCNDNLKNSIKFDNNILLERSSSFGGLGNKWLGGSSLYNKNDFKKKNFLKKLPSLQKKIIKKHFTFKKKLCLNKLPFGIKNIISNNNSKINFINPLTLKDLLKKKNVLKVKRFDDVEYLNFKLFNFNKVNNEFICHCENSNKKLKIITDYLFLGCGTIDTSILLMKFLKLKKITFRHQPYFYGLALNKKKKIVKFKNFDSAIVHYYFKNQKYDCSGAIGLYSNRVINYVNENFRIPNFFLKTLKNFFFNYAIFFNCFLNSKYNEIYISRHNNNFNYFSNLS